MIGSCEILEGLAWFVHGSFTDRLVSLYQLKVVGTGVRDDAVSITVEVESWAEVLLQLKIANLL